MNNITINTMINGQRVEVEVSAAEVLYIAHQIEENLHKQTQNIMVFAADAYNWNNGQTTPSIGIRRVGKTGGDEIPTMTDDICWLIAGTLRRIDNDKEIVRLRELMAIGYNNAYVDLRAQAMCAGFLSTPKLGKREITDMQVVGERAYLTLAPMT